LSWRKLEAATGVPMHLLRARLGNVRSDDKGSPTKFQEEKMIMGKRQDLIYHPYHR
jgi:hypothetical protein